MKVSCDICGRTATGSKGDLMDAGWNRVVVSSPIKKTFTGCPDHALRITKEAVAAIRGIE